MDSLVLARDMPAKGVRRRVDLVETADNGAETPISY